MDYTETTDNGIVTRTYSNGATVVYANAPIVDIPVAPTAPQPTNQEINDNLNTLLDAITDVYIQQLGGN
jgi:hypothetical protein